MTARWQLDKAAHKLFLFQLQRRRKYGPSRWTLACRWGLLTKPREAISLPGCAWQIAPAVWKNYFKLKSRCFNGIAERETISLAWMKPGGKQTWYSQDTRVWGQIWIVFWRVEIAAAVTIFLNKFHMSSFLGSVFKKRESRMNFQMCFSTSLQPKLSQLQVNPPHKQNIYQALVGDNAKKKISTHKAQWQEDNM